MSPDQIKKIKAILDDGNGTLLYWDNHTYLTVRKIDGNSISFYPYNGNHYDMSNSPDIKYENFFIANRASEMSDEES